MAPQDRALSSSRVVEVAVQALGIETHGEATVKSPCEAVALIGHSCMISVGFRLIGLGEEGCVGKFLASFIFTVVSGLYQRFQFP